MDEIDIEEFRKNIDKCSNNKLCEIIVAQRYLGIMKEEALVSMEELAKRRTNGDQFAYEKHIDELFETLPKLNLDLNSIVKKFPKIQQIK
jgi:hypothetical protein